ncbi:hypothetical protein BKA64DRAFT_200807 [Cadophora sp. MPI-SDFR-AT-0126]|nr:hypothetical protein BKA64DRAFT_200807 [Leotiomycetes sp. MPI-SDFR-AT-0126]
MDNQPFSDEEKRFVLAEAIRTSQIPLERLFAFLNENSSIPAWDDMLVPRGRNLKQCKDAFESLRFSPPAPIFQPHLQSQSHGHSQSQSQSHNLPVPSASSGIKRKSAPGAMEPFSPAAGPPAKRRQSSGDPVSTARDIRPKPSNGSPLSMTSFPTQEPKKRGRPSKKDVERKQQEAIARGDILPPVSSMGYQMQGEEVSVSGYAPILPAVTPTLQYAPSPGIPIEREIPESAGSPGKKRRPKATPKAPKAAPKQPGEGSFKVNTTVGSKIEHEEPPATTSIATSDAAPVTGPVEVASSVPSSLPAATAAPPPLIPTNQPPPDI